MGVLVWVVVRVLVWGIVILVWVVVGALVWDGVVVLFWVGVVGVPVWA